MATGAKERWSVAIMGKDEMDSLSERSEPCDELPEVEPDAELEALVQRYAERMGKVVDQMETSCKTVEELAEAMAVSVEGGRRMWAAIERVMAEFKPEVDE